MKATTTSRIPFVSHKFLIAILTLVISFSVSAQITVSSAMTPAQFVQNVLLGPGITAMNITYNGSAAAANVAQGNVSSFDATVTPFQIQQGLLLTTGTGAIAVGPNGLAASSSGGTPNVSADPDLNVLAAGTVTNGVFLEFDFVSATNQISFDYIFGSEEYPEFAPPNSSAFNDVFGFLLSGPGIAGGQGFLNNAVNIAVLPSLAFVSINNVNPVTNAGFFADNTGGAAHGTAIQYDGTTIKLTASRAIDCGVTYHIKMCICNVGDTGFDSGVFLESNSFASTANISAGPPQSVCGTVGGTINLAGSSGSTTGTVWTSTGTGVFSNPTNPTGTYTVTAADIAAGSITLTYAGFNFCSGAPVTSSTVVNFVSPIATVNPTAVTICLPATPTAPLVGTANANTSVRVFRTFTNSTAGNIPNNNAGGVSRTIAVAGITPNDLATNPIVSVIVNITHAKSRELELRLISPSGQNFQLVPSSTGLFGAGANFTGTVFTTSLLNPTIGGANPPFNGSFRPQTPLTNFTGVINGNWTLMAIDAFGSFINNVPNNNNVGQLLNWSITFQTDNFITSTVWTPALNITSTTTLNTIVSPPTSTVYTLTVTDAIGCVTQVPVAITVANCALPVELVSLSASCENGAQQLSWEVESEENNDYFEVQKSENGTNFEAIGIVQSVGDHTERVNYQFVDFEKSNSETIYYRLNQVDRDAASSIYGPIPANEDCLTEKQACFNVFPSVVENDFFMNVTDSKVNDSFNYSIIDLNGKIVIENNYKATTDNYNFLVDIPDNMAKGTYLVVLQNGTELCQNKIVVVK